MAVNVTNLMRCNSKNLAPAPPPPPVLPGATGSPATDVVNVAFTLVPETGNVATSGNTSLAVAMTDDRFVVGAYYNVTITDGQAPTAASQGQGQ
jgi:hypothetical protein